MADLTGTDLSWVNLSRAGLAGANLGGAELSMADLDEANLSEANLVEANLTATGLLKANLFRADLSSANLSAANLAGADLSEAKLAGANLEGANLSAANLFEANLTGAYLANADLSGASLTKANLHGADLTFANLQRAILVDTKFTNAVLVECHIYGISAWHLDLKEAIQAGLIVTKHDHPKVTVDDIEVGQLFYLLLNNEKIRNVIDTITSKVVLLLGRFTPERKAVLDALREELRRRDYLPVLFDFDKPASMDLTGTVSTLARLARFIVADLTDPSSIPYELATVIPSTVVPVQPVLLAGKSEFAMFADLRARHHWVLATYVYASPEKLIASLDKRVIGPAEAKALELQGVKPPG